MNKGSLNPISTWFVRGASSLGLLVITTNLVPLAHGQVHSSNSSPRSRNGSDAKTVVRVHDTTERTQTRSAQQNYGVTRPGSPAGVICSVESRAAHGQVAPNTNGGTLNPVAFINPTTINASGRIAFNSQCFR